MSDQDQERRDRFREIIETMDEQYGEVFRWLAQDEPEEADHDEISYDEISDEERQAAADRVIERYGDTLKRLADS
jgi:hypothetical protein